MNIKIVSSILRGEVKTKLLSLTTLGLTSLLLSLPTILLSETLPAMAQSCSVIGQDYGSAVNLRSGPSLNFSVIASGAVGDSITLVERQGDWSKVRLSKNGATGWMFNKYVGC